MNLLLLEEARIQFLFKKDEQDFSPRNPSSHEEEPWSTTETCRTRVDPTALKQPEVGPLSLSDKPSHTCRVMDLHTDQTFSTRELTVLSDVDL